MSNTAKCWKKYNWRDLGDKKQKVKSYDEQINLIDYMDKQPS